MNITDSFIQNILDFSKRTFSEEVYHHAQKCYLDYLGCALAGAKYNQNRLSSWFSEFTSEGNCSVFGTTLKMQFRDAGFINGFNSHALELDDGHRYAMLHIEAPIFSAMSALFEKEHLSEDAFYKGVIVGYEVTVRISRSIQPWHKVRGFHSTGTCATIGVAMAAAVAMNFDFNQTKAALTAASSSAAGLLEVLADDSELKPYNVGRAVMDGLTAAYIGRVGFISPDDIIGGKRGFLSVMSDTYKSDYLTFFAEDDKPCILGNFFKPYPSCRHCHPTIDAALQIARQNDFYLKNIDKIRIETYDLALVGHDHIVVNSTKSAMMSIPYGAVIALANKEVGLMQYSESIVKSAEIQTLLNKVEICENPSLTLQLPNIRGAVVEVSVGGKVYKCQVDHSLGEPENPMNDDDVIKKFLGLAKFAGLQENKANEVIRDVFRGKFVFGL